MYLRSLLQNHNVGAASSNFSNFILLNRKHLENSVQVCKKRILKSACK